MRIMHDVRRVCLSYLLKLLIRENSEGEEDDAEEGERKEEKAKK